MTGEKLKTSSEKAAKQSKASKAKACTVIVAGEPSTEAANYTEEKVNFSCMFTKQQHLLPLYIQKFKLYCVLIHALMVKSRDDFNLYRIDVKRDNFV